MGCFRLGEPAEGSLVALHVVDEQAAKAAVQMTVAAFGRLDVVVNNAGYGDIAPFEQLSSEKFKALMDTNFYGVVNAARAALLAKTLT